MKLHFKRTLGRSARRAQRWGAAALSLGLIAGGGTLLTAMPAAAAPAQAISCDAGVVYAIGGTGQLQVVKNGTKTDVGTAASGVNSFNGLGIGTGGSPIYAYERGNRSSMSIYQYNAGAGTWAKVKDYTLSGNFSAGSLVAGAVNLATGDYYFGGYSGSGNSQTFQLWKYSGGNVAKVGYINAPAISGESGANGDIAFDANGNLFVVLGAGNSTKVFSVTAANLASPAGSGLITSSASNSFTTTTDVNGVAFDADGKAYLGAKSNLQSFDMPNWSNKQTVTSDLSNSTDLASCSSPSTITVQKDVVGRAASGDQFTLTASQGSTTLGTGTTTGNDTGVQDGDGEMVGPLPAQTGVALSFGEAAASDTSTSLSNYASAYECKADGVHMDSASGTGISGTVTIPTGTKAVVCTIKNSPLTANVTIHKDVVDANGQNATAGVGWTMSAATTVTAGTVTSNPTAAAQQTNDSGDANWALKFGTTASRATVKVSETQQTGYAFDKGSCVITHLDGTTNTTTLTDESAKSLTGVQPGDSVKCTYQNKKAKAALTLVKKVDNTNGGDAAATDWTLNAAGPTNISGTTGSSVVTNAQVDPGTYTLSEAGGPTGYEQSGNWDCGSATVTDSKVAVKAGDTVTCTVTNKSKPGTVTWTKTDEGGNALKGSEWQLSGPTGAGSTDTAVTDCVAASAADCTGTDKDPAAGKFEIDGLKWGEYTLTETKAPVGYQKLTTAVKKTIDGDHLSVSFGQIKNDQAEAPSLPLTGGRGAQAFLFGGLALLALAVGGGIYAAKRRGARR